MQNANPLKYTDISQEQFDQFKLLAKAKGLNLTGNKDTENLDGIGIGVEYTSEKKELNFTVHVPIWMAEATAVGIIHLLVCGAVVPTDSGTVQAEHKEATVAKKYEPTHTHRR